MEPTVREARQEDVPVLVEFNSRLAAETEGKSLDPEVLRRGVRALLDDRSRGRYFVATVGERIVGQVMITYEWSDWRNGFIWWLQSVYVESAHRRRGVFRRLFGHVAALCDRDPDVVGLRLYVEDNNRPAQETYQRLGMMRPGYHVLERLRGPEERDRG